MIHGTQPTEISENFRNGRHTVRISYISGHQMRQWDICLLLYYCVFALYPATKSNSIISPDRMLELAKHLRPRLKGVVSPKYRNCVTLLLIQYTWQGLIINGLWGPASRTGQRCNCTWPENGWAQLVGYIKKYNELGCSVVLSGKEKNQYI